MSARVVGLVALLASGLAAAEDGSATAESGSVFATGSPEVVYQGHLAAVVDSRGRCVTCADGEDLEAMLRADAAANAAHADDVARILERLRALWERPRVSSDDELQRGVDYLCLEQLHRRDRLLFHEKVGLMIVVADLATLDVVAALAKPLAAKPAVFGVPLTATLPALACRAEPVVSDCSYGDDLWSAFPSVVQGSEKLWTVQCRGPKGVVYFESDVGKMTAAQLDPTEHGVDAAALLAEVKRSYGKAQRRSTLTVLLIRVEVWSIALARGGIFFEVPAGQTGEPIGVLEYRDTTAISGLHKRQRAARKADDAARAREIAP